MDIINIIYYGLCLALLIAVIFYARSRSNANRYYRVVWQSYHNNSTHRGRIYFEIENGKYLNESFAMSRIKQLYSIESDILITDLMEISASDFTDLTTEQA